MARMEQKARPHMFVVQIWPIAVDGSDTLRGSVEHVAHRRPVYFSSYDHLVEFIRSQVDEQKEGVSSR